MSSSSTLAILREQFGDRTSAPQQLAILADPVFSQGDGRIRSQRTTQRGEISDPDELALKRSARQLDVGSWDRLPGTRIEAEAIVDLVPESERIEKFDFDANLTTATSPELSKYRIVHLATHGILNSESPELSGLVLSLVDEQGNSQNGLLESKEMLPPRSSPSKPGVRLSPHRASSINRGLTPVLIPRNA